MLTAAQLSRVTKSVPVCLAEGYVEVHGEEGLQFIGSDAWKLFRTHLQSKYKWSAELVEDTYPTRVYNKGNLNG